jgi:uncharacterized protein YndB with AHSA1/START domain
MNSITAKAQTVVRASPLAVFNAFIDAETMSKFWFTRRDERLHEGMTVSWFIGQAEDAYAIEVNVIELRQPELIRIEWWGGEYFTQVLWKILPTDDGHTNLAIEESGFKGSEDEIVSSALNSTGGFNQVIIAVKALLEHETIINVVDDHV